MLCAKLKEDLAWGEMCLEFLNPKSIIKWEHSREPLKAFAVWREWTMEEVLFSYRRPWADIEKAGSGGKFGQILIETQRKHVSTKTSEP